MKSSWWYLIIAIVVMVLVVIITFITKWFVNKKRYNSYTLDQIKQMIKQAVNHYESATSQQNNNIKFALLTNALENVDNARRFLDDTQLETLSRVNIGRFHSLIMSMMQPSGSYSSVNNNNIYGSSAPGTSSGIGTSTTTTTTTGFSPLSVPPTMQQQQQGLTPFSTTNIIPRVV